jgi:RNA methyltransferase, TrmH family
MVTQITSRTNPNVQRWKALASHAQPEENGTLIWVEGEHLLQEARRAGVTAVEVIACEGRHVTDYAVTHLVSRQVMTAVSQLESAAAIAAVLRVKSAGVVPVPTDCLILDRVQDPGNVGTMLRTAWAFGVKHVLMTTGCASPWSMKALRAGQGAQFWLSIAERISPAQLSDTMRVPVLVAAASSASALSAVDLRSPCAFAFGHEGQGVSPEIAALATQRVHIAMPGGAESLNVAAACAICLYEQQRQRTVIA